MKIAFSCHGGNLDMLLDERFGRAANFLIYDTADASQTVVPNDQNLNALQGAGIQAAVKVAEAGAEAIITGHCGPKAFRVLHEAGIKVYLCHALTCQEALRQFEAGELMPLAAADVEGHWA